MNRPSHGRLIAFEGIDGSGKSTQLARLAQALRQAGVALLETREPTDGPWGRRIRAAARGEVEAAPGDELHWFVEDRREHVAEVLSPALASGRTVLTDRYFLSTVAYQGARGHDWRALLRQSEAEFPLPDLVLLLEIDPAQGLDRVHARGAQREALFEDARRLQRVAEIFRAIERPYIHRIDASQSPDPVAQQVLEVVAPPTDA